MNIPTYLLALHLHGPCFTPPQNTLLIDHQEGRQRLLFISHLLHFYFIINFFCSIPNHLKWRPYNGTKYIFQKNETTLINQPLHKTLATFTTLAILKADKVLVVSYGLFHFLLYAFFSRWVKSKLPKKSMRSRDTLS